MKQKWYEMHLESLCQNVGGLIISYILLTYVFNIPPFQSVQMQIAFFFASYIRSYLIRWSFNHYLHRKNI